MKILVVGHAYLSEINREKWSAYKKIFPNDCVSVVTPERWNDALFTVQTSSVDSCRNSGGYIHLPIKNSGNEVLHRYSWTDVWRVMNLVSPDILLVEQGDNSFAYFQWILVSLLQLRFIPRVFFTWVNWTHSWGWRYKAFWWPIEACISFFSNAAIVGNPEAQQLLRNKGFKEPILISPQLGVGIIDFQNTIEIEQKKRKRIGFVGRLTHEKGVHLLLRAFADISSNFSDWEVCIVGNGPQHENLAQLALEFNITKNVVFVGSVDHYRAINFIKTFDILVLPSLDVPTWKEQFGHVLIEAMAAHIPVICSDAGAIAWVIGDAGLVFEQNSVEGLREALQKYMLHQDVREAYGERGFKRCCELYSHEVIARNIGNFLHTLVQ